MRHKIFYDMVKKLAKEKDKTIEVVVNEAGITLDSYNSTRRGYKKLPRADLAVKIAAVLNTSVEFLVTGNTAVFRADSIKEKKDMYLRLDELEKTIKQCKEKFK